MSLKGYKTYLFFGLTLAASLAGLIGFSDWQPTATQAELILALTSLAGIILRTVTDSPPFKQE